MDPATRPASLPILEYPFESLLYLGLFSWREKERKNYSRQTTDILY